MRVIDEIEVFLTQRPSMVHEGVDAFLNQQGLHWPTPTEGVADAERSIELAGRLCYDDQTEVLSKTQGWVLFKDLIKNTPILTINPDTEFAEWQIPNFYTTDPYKGDLYTVEGRELSLAVTPEHRMWGRYPGDIRNHFQEAQEIDQKPFYIPLAAKGWKGEIPEILEIPDVPYEQSESAANNSRFSKGRTLKGQEVLSWAYLMTYYVTEGYTEDYGVQITGDHITPVSQLAQEAGFYLGEPDVDPRNGCPRVRIAGGKALAQYVQDNYGDYAPNKKLPRWILELPKFALEKIWDIMTRTGGDPNRTPRFLSSSPHLMAAAQEILVKIGRGQNTRSRNQMFTRTPYEGVVYCVNTNNGILVVRRKGKVAISGNCYMSFGSKAGSKTNEAYLKNLLGILPDGSFRPGPAHGSVTEHACYSFIVVGGSRGFTHEQVRHRAGFGYSQLSTRYVDYELEETPEGDWEPAYVIPPLGKLSQKTRDLYVKSFQQSQASYCEILHSIEDDLKANEAFMLELEKLTPKDRARALRKAARGAAREVLPNATEALIFITGNARAIWNTIGLRANGEAEAVIRNVYVKIAKIMQVEMPTLFKGLTYYNVWDGSQAVKLPRDNI